ncbi:MAG: hypothetical protein KKA79_05660 [Nanoarchaeota archaeon]|nr:hypothetical protein [Nanoarchaeota archaeon]
MKIITPVLEKDGKNSKISEHFGQAKYFALYDSETKKTKFIDRTSEHIEGACTPVAEMMQYKPDAIFVLGMGYRAVEMFKTRGVQVKSGNYSRLSEVIENLDKLEDFEGACMHH